MKTDNARSPSPSLMRQLHFPTLFFCGGSAFTMPWIYSQTADWVSRVISISGLFYICIVLCIYLFKKSEHIPHLDKILNSFFIIGLFEIAYSIFQILNIIPSNSPYFSFTGSFSNPSILSMVLSLCIPIGFHFLKNSHPSNSLFWKLSIIAICCIIILSESRSGIISFFFSIYIIKHQQIMSSIKKWPKWRLTFLLFILISSFIGLYLYKQDSSDGRVLAWKIAIKMISDRPWLGWGNTGFDAHYMVYQACYFTHNHDSMYNLLADNLSHPFNEFILFTIKYGIIGLALLIVALAYIFHNTICNQYKFKTIFISQYFTLLLWSTFSYPFMIPITWLVTSFIIFASLYSRFTETKLTKIITSCIIATFIYSLTPSIASLKDEIKWLHVQKKALTEDPQKILPLYDQLYTTLNNNGLLLYNYGAELHYAKHYQKSLDILNECTHWLNDYNIQMLIADNLQNLGRLKEAINKYQYANKMVPNRFLPLYYEMQIHIANQDSTHAYRTAERIINKPIKIKNSKVIKEIIKQAEFCFAKYQKQ